MSRIWKMLPKIVFLLVLLGFAFPMKAPVSLAKGKMCCKGTCWMAPAPMKLSGESPGKRMISCCQKNCSAVSDRRVAPPSNPGFSKVSTKFLASGDGLPLLLSPPGADSRPLFAPLRFPLNTAGTTRPIFQVHSVYLI